MCAGAHERFGPAVRNDAPFDVAFTDNNGFTVTKTIAVTITGTNDEADPNDYDQANDNGSGQKTTLTSRDIHILSNDSDLFPAPGTTLNQTTAIYALAGNDTVSGGNQIDYIYGGSGSDSIGRRLYSERSSEHGGSGNDNIDGGSGSGIIVGGFGADTLTGGGAPGNRFQYWSPKDGGDSITDYTVGQDQLEFVVAGSHTIDGTRRCRCSARCRRPQHRPGRRCCRGSPLAR